MASPQAIEMTVNGTTTVLNFTDLGPRDSAKLRKATGVSLIAAFSDADSMDLDILCALWWLARVKNGEPYLTWDQALDAFPSFSNMDAFKVQIIEDASEDDESPLA